MEWQAEGPVQEKERKKLIQVTNWWQFESLIAN